MTIETSLHAFGEEERGLTRGVAATDDDDRRSGAQTSLDLGGRVVHAVVLEIRQARCVEPPVAGAAGDDHGAAGDLGSVGQADHQIAAGLAQLGRRARTGQPGAELLGLHDGSLSEVAAGDSRRKPEVVLDPRAGSGLAAGRDHLHDQGVETFRRAVDAGRETGRPAADDDEVEASLG